MYKLNQSQRNNVRSLFEAPTSSIILAALYSDIGEIWCDDILKPKVGIIFAENTIYISGKAINKETIDFLTEKISENGASKFTIIPQNSFMINYFSELFGQAKYKDIVIKSERHLMDIKLENINHEKLELYAKEILSHYEVKAIDEELYIKASNDKYASNFVRNFKDYNDFSKNGFGYFILDNSEIIAGISSCARYENGVEVQIAVSPKYRGNHIARSLGATFVLECKRRNLYPWWDCANSTSEHIATELGYVLKHITPIFKVNYENAHRFV